MFNLLFGVACETKILEACNWDEERAKYLSEILSSILEENANSKSISPEAAIASLKIRLSDIANDQEINALVEIVNESVENMPFLLMKEEEYEN
jgi:hypothetical protein